MLSPWFLGPIILIATFFITHEPMSVQLVWKILRPIAMGFVVFYALRFLPLDKYLLKFIDPKGATGLALIKVFATLRRFASRGAQVYTGGMWTEGLRGAARRWY